jgi:hypothetical protein
MNTNLIMTFSAICLGLAGIALSFLPDELQAFAGLNPGVSSGIILPLLGALYFAFAMLNWMARGSFIGGIYNRPIAVANFTHFFIGAISISRYAFRSADHTPALWAVAALYIIFAVLFAIMLMRHPRRYK